MRARSVLAVVVAASLGVSIRADEILTAESFARLHALIKPQMGESQWARISWLTNLDEARRRSVAEDKPIILWRAGGGDVLGRA
jgi:hypothetical protein